MASRPAFSSEICVTSSLVLDIMVLMSTERPASSRIEHGAVLAEKSPSSTRLVTSAMLRIGRERLLEKNQAATRPAIRRTEVTMAMSRPISFSVALRSERKRLVLTTAGMESPIDMGTAV